jgi:hypothetical protein
MPNLKEAARRNPLFVVLVPTILILHFGWPLLKPEKKTQPVAEVVPSEPPKPKSKWD